MDEEETIKLHPAEVLRQAASSGGFVSGRGYDELSVILPVRTTLTTALHAAEKSLENVDEEMVMMPPRGSGRRHLREIALQTVQEWNEGSPPLMSGGRGLNIRTSIDLTTLPSPEPIPEQFRENIREIAKRDAKEPFRQPYVTLRAQSADRYLPVVTANLGLQALDGEDKDLKCQLNSVEMFWDTGAHRTIITEEILPIEFREYLKDPVHEPYRLFNGLSVQIDATIAFTNRAMSITALS